MTEHKYMNTNRERERMVSGDEDAESGMASYNCVKTVCVCVVPTHPVMHMPCKKPRPQGVCVTKEQEKREVW